MMSLETTARCWKGRRPSPGAISTVTASTTSLSRWPADPPLQGSCPLKKRAFLSASPSLRRSCLGVASAADTADQGKTLFNAGASAYAAGQFNAAIQAFDESYRLVAAPGRPLLDRPGPPAAILRRQAARAPQERDSILPRLPRQGGRGGPPRRRRTGPLRARAAGRAARLPAPPRRAAPPAAPSPETRLMVSSPTRGATVSVDKGKALEAPLITEITPGKHALHLTRRGLFRRGPGDQRLRPAASRRSTSPCASGRASS